MVYAGPHEGLPLGALGHIKLPREANASSARWLLVSSRAFSLVWITSWRRSANGVRIVLAGLLAPLLRLPELKPVAFRVGRPAEPAVVVGLDLVLDRGAGGSELRQHGVQ